MAKPHEYILVLPDGTCEITKSNGPICFQQSRQELGGTFETWNPELGLSYTAQIHDEMNASELKPNVTFEGVVGNVLIGRAHGNDMWGLSAGQRDELLLRLRTVRPGSQNEVVSDLTSVSD